MKRLAIILILIGIGINLYSQRDTVIFSASGGFYENSFVLTLINNNPENRIFYTINGNTPTTQSYQYTQPLHLDENLYSQSDIYKIRNTPDSSWYEPNEIKKCIVIRAAAFDSNDNIISDVMTNSYFISSLGADNNGLPTISICADSTALFDYETGIFIPGIHYDPSIEKSGNYFQKGREWERICNLEYYMHDTSSLNQIAGIRIHGNATRKLQQKGFSLYAREEYGEKSFKCKLFATSDINKFKHLVIRPIRCSWTNAGIEDYICQKIAKELNVESLDTRPCVVYLNGEYWGIYYLQEKADERYLENHFNSESNNYNIMEDWFDKVNFGNPENFVRMMSWIRNSDISQRENYESLCQMIDIDCFIDYFALELFIDNYDWPANNMKCWQDINSPWRWIFFDGDGTLRYLHSSSFGHIIDTGDYEWPTNEKSTLLFRKLITNRTFCQNFSNRFHELAETSFQYSNTKIYKEQIINEISRELQNQMNRFNYPVYEYHINNIAIIDTFLNTRPSKIIDDLEHFIPMSIMQNTIDSEIKCFPNPTSDYINISISNTKWGVVRIDIFDLQGRTVYSDIVFCDKGENIHTIDIHNLPQGTYITRVGEKIQKVVKIQ